MGVCMRVCRKLGKKVQTELAEANAVADEALTNIATVRVHAAEDSVKANYAAKLHDFYVLQVLHCLPPGRALSLMRHFPYIVEICK